MPASRGTVSTGRNTGASMYKRKPAADLDPIMNASQSSSDDGMMATIAQQMQVSMEKNKKEKETRFLQAAQTELSRVITERAQEFSDAVSDIDRTFLTFQDAYAVNEDLIRKLWEELLAEQSILQNVLKEKHAAMAEREKVREKEHIQSLAHARKACEDFQRLIVSLDPDHEV